MQSDFVFTSESVTEGHPDKLCDKISDAIVAHYLRQDPGARVVAECAASTGIVFLSVKSHSLASADLAGVARRVIQQVGYDDNGFDARTCAVMTSVQELSDEEMPRLDEIALSADEIDRVTARDQATVFGYACTHTPMLMPLPIAVAHRLARRLAEVRSERSLRYLTPDGKVQVGIEFRRRRPQRIHTISILAAQKRADRPTEQQLRDDLIEHVVRPVFATEEIRPDPETRIAINPEGRVVGGGPALHAGLTGRKNAVDTYGEFARHSGSALSGKDPGRIDRVGVYAARYAAKNVVAAGLAEHCEVVLSYSVGLAHPVSIHVETYGTGKVSEEEIARRIRANFDFRVAAISRQFRLRLLPALREGGFFPELAAYGHVGRSDLQLPWEATDKVDVLRA